MGLVLTVIEQIDISNPTLGWNYKCAWYIIVKLRVVRLMEGFYLGHFSGICSSWWRDIKYINKDVGDNLECFSKGFLVKLGMRKK